jgi:hypothetical protein
MSDTPATPAPSDSQAPIQANETPAQKEKRLLEAKVNGKVVKVDEETLLRDYQKYASADEKFRQAAQYNKQLAEFKEAFKKDPEAALEASDLPEDVKVQLAEKWLLKSLEKQMQPQRSKEQEELEELKRFKAEVERQKQEEMTKKEKEEFDRAVAQRREAISKTIQDAISLSPLAKDPSTSAEVVREMALYMRLCKANGYEVDARELAKHVEQRFRTSHSSLASSLDGQDLIEYLGPDIIKKIRKYDLAQLEASRRAKEPETAPADSWESKDNRKKRTFTDPRDLIRRK